MQPKSEKSYIWIGRATDLKGTSDYFKYRLLEILPGALTWGTLVAMIVVSYWAPIYAAIFMILFALYWFLRTVYFTVHLCVSFNLLRKNVATRWRERLEQLPANSHKLPISSWRDILHVVILPIYNEPYEIIYESIVSLRGSSFPPEQMILVIAAEERAADKMKDVVSRIEKEFREDFSQFIITWHPSGIPGELAGKGANVAWAGKKLWNDFLKPQGILADRVIVSVFDADTIVGSGFFDCLTYYYLTAEKPLRSSFQPIPFFVNNIWHAPVFARVIGFTSTFLQMMQQARPERLVTFSSHSMPLKALVEIGFWQTNVVSEDVRIFYQSFLFYDSDWRVVPMHFPVLMDANFAGTFWNALKSQYRQQRRWGYGAESIPYLFYGMSKNKLIPLRMKLKRGFDVIEGFYTWTTSPLLLFCLGWLPFIFWQNQLFAHNLLLFSLPQIIQWIMVFSMIGLIASAVISIMILPPRPLQFRPWKTAVMFLQWLLMPVIILFLSAIPVIDAETRLMFGRYMGFWSTPKDRKQAEKKSKKY